MTNHIQTVHDRMQFSHFLSYLSQMLIDFASIWVFFKLPRPQKITVLEIEDRGPSSGKAGTFLIAEFLFL